MDIINLIRAFIFLLAGLLLIIFRDKYYKFQVYLVKKLRIKYNVERDRKYYPHICILLIFISMVLFVFSIIN